MPLVSRSNPLTLRGYYGKESEEGEEGEKGEEGQEEVNFCARVGPRSARAPRKVMFRSLRRAWPASFIFWESRAAEAAIEVFQRLQCFKKPQRGR
jgi:hypothetical protein